MNKENTLPFEDRFNDLSLKLLTLLKRSAECGDLFEPPRQSREAERMIGQLAFFIAKQHNTWYLDIDPQDVLKSIARGAKRAIEDAVENKDDEGFYAANFDTSCICNIAKSAVSAEEHD